MGMSVGKPFSRPNLSNTGFYGTQDNSDQNLPGFLKPGVFQQRPTFDFPGAPTMPPNPYAQQAWIRNTPNAMGKPKIE